MAGLLKKAVERGEGKQYPSKINYSILFNDLSGNSMGMSLMYDFRHTDVG